MRILTVQNRMGIGDMVIFLPFIEAISKNFGFPISILVKENSKAIQFLKENKNINQIKNFVSKQLLMIFFFPTCVNLIRMILTSFGQNLQMKKLNGLKVLKVAVRVMLHISSGSKKGN